MTYLQVHQSASPPSPTDVGGYLLQAGWSHARTDNLWAVYSKEINDQVVEVEVPQRATALDYARSVALLLEDLSQIEGRSEPAILRDIKNTSLDVVRLAIEGTTIHDGRVSVEGGWKVYRAVRDLLLAAACSVLDPRPVFTKRKPDEAMRLLDRTRFGLPELGSLVVTVECSVPPRLGQQTILDDHTDPETPLERRTTALLARALEATEGAGRAAGAANDIGPFRAREREGVSANLCDAVAELIEATTADVVRASIAFASRRPAVIALPRSAAFSADLAPILRQAAVQLREEATYAAIEVVGVIVKLESDNADVGGVAVMRANIEDRMRHVRIPMEREPYQRAIQAHAERSLVQCTGDLSRQGRDWVLGNARDLAVVDVRA